MSPSALIPLLGFCGLIVLIVVVARQSLHRRINQLFIWYVFLLAAWAFGSFMLYADFPRGMSTYFWNSFLIVPLMLAPVAFFHFVHAFLMKPEPRLWLSLGYGLGILFAIAAALGYTVNYAYWSEGSYHMELGLATFAMTPVALAFVAASVFNLVQWYRRTKDPFTRNRIAYPLIGISIASLLSLTNFIPGWKWYPVDQAGNLLNALLLSYATLRYRLLDIGFALRKGYLYSVLTIFVLAIFLCSTLLLQGAFRDHAGYGFGIAALVTAVILAIAFQPVYGMVRRWVDRRFYGESYNYRQTLINASQKMGAMLDLDELSEWLVNNLKETMSASKAGLFLLDPGTQRYVPRVLRGYDNSSVDKVWLRKENPVVKHVARGNGCLTMEEIDCTPQLRSLSRAERGPLKQLETAVLLPLKVKEELIGMVVLGPKLSELTYSLDDLDLLLTVANQAAVALENARLYETSQLRAKELKESEGKYRTLVNDINDAYIVLRRDRIIFANERLAEMSGVSLEKIIEEPFFKLIAPESQETLRQIYEASMRGETPQEKVALVFIRPDGTKTYIELAFRDIIYEGKPAVSAIARDITERKRAEEELKESEELSRGILKSATAGIYVIQEGKFQYISPQFEEITGYTSDELMGTYSIDLIHPEDRGAARKGAIANLKGETISPYAFRFIRKDGGAIWVLEKLASIQYKGKRAAVGSLMDITERKRAEVEIIERNKQMAVTSEVSRIIGSSLDIRDVYQAFTAEIKKVVDFDRASIGLVEGDKLRLFAVSQEGETELGDGATVPLEGSATAWVMENKRTNIETDFTQEMQFPSDKKRLQSGLSSAIRLPLFSKGEVIGTFNLSSRHPNAYGERERDILGHLAGQIAVAVENSRLFIKIREREMQLSSAYEELKAAQDYMVQSERLRALGEMAGGMAHDFNNVLAVILGRAQLAMEDTQDPKVKGALQIIKQSATDAAQTVRRLQDFARVRLDRALEMVDLNQVVESALQMVESRRLERQETEGVVIDISTELEKVAPVEGNPAELKEALVNILFNAMDAMPKGGKITVKSELKNHSVILSLSDTGVGIPEKIKGRVFDPFFTTKGSKGLGMGLSVTYGTISRHGGSINFESTVGKGTTFYIGLPAARGPRKKPPPAKMPPSVEKTTILLIDDNPQVSEVLRLMLEQLGHQVTGFTSAKEALDAFEKGDYKLVVTDLGMPDIAGRDVAKAIKRVKPETPVVLITGWGMQLDPEELKEVGVDGVIAKPFTKEVISTKLAELLNNTEETAGIGREDW